jgi:FkbM family methyltransferase
MEMHHVKKLLPNPCKIFLQKKIAVLSALIPINRIILLIQAHAFEDVIDVGSNRGEWSSQVVPHLKLAKNSKIYLIEPLCTISSEVKMKLSKKGDVITVPLAAGNSKGSFPIHVASNDGESSSFLEFASAHIEAAPSIHFVKNKNVYMDTLDNICSEILGRKNTLLKIDVQGFELEVLKGASKLLKQCKVIVIEASLSESYLTGSTLFSIASKLRNNGFQLAGLVESFRRETTEK